MYSSLSLDCGGKLSVREQNVLALALEGKTDKEIAVDLQITCGTVRTYWERMRVKLVCVNRLHIAAKVFQHLLTTASVHTQISA